VGAAALDRLKNDAVPTAWTVDNPEPKLDRRESFPQLFVGAV
jgi:hypothetical protein